MRFREVPTRSELSLLKVIWPKLMKNKYFSKIFEKCKYLKDREDSPVETTDPELVYLESHG